MNIFKDNNDWNEKTIIGAMAFFVMCVVMALDLSTGYWGLELTINKFDPRMDKCLLEQKKKLFEYYFEDIKNQAKKFNQKILVITFNLQEDLSKNPSFFFLPSAA